MFSGVEKANSIITFCSKNISGEASLLQIKLYLEVCLKDGVLMKELEKKLGLSQSSVSKNVKLFSKYYEIINGEKVLSGHDLLRVEPDLEDRRALAVYLTTKGKRLKAELEEVVGKAGG